MEIRAMVPQDYERVFAMWQITSKRALSHADEKEPMIKYLERNKGLSQVAVVDGEIVGTVLAGHDGRRGFIHHMAVLPEYRRQGIAKQMAKKAIKGLQKEGIDKTHLFCYEDNKTGQAFWKSLGFEKREDIFVFSSQTELTQNVKSTHCQG
ncbi:MAG: GNAT family N-acetyltransferase [Acutalibacteraceae bacterium]